MASNQEAAVNRAKGVLSGLQAERASLASNGGSKDQLKVLDGKIKDAGGAVATAEGALATAVAGQAKSPFW